MLRSNMQNYVKTRMLEAIDVRSRGLGSELQPTALFAQLLDFTKAITVHGRGTGKLTGVPV